MLWMDIGGGDELARGLDATRTLGNQPADCWLEKCSNSMAEAMERLRKLQEFDNGGNK